jgi:elongation factor P
VSIQANDLRRGMHVYYNGAPCRVLEIEIRSPGKGRAFVQAKLRNVLDGTQREVKFSTADQVDEAAIETREMDYLYSSADGAIFMDSENYEQMTLSGFGARHARPGWPST